MTTTSAFPLRPMAFAASLLLAGAAIGLGGCASTDPLLPERQGLWHPTHANEANLAAMVANPSDLRHGVSEPGSDGILAAAAVRRLHRDQVKQLPESSIVQLGSSGGGGGGGGGASLSGGE